MKLPDEQTCEVETFEPAFLTWPEVERVAAECAWVEPMYGLVVRFSAATGLRPAEVAGLNVEDIHILGDRGEVAVRRTRTLTRGRGWVVGQPKTKTSRRSVPLLFPEVVAELALYLAAHPRHGVGDAPLFYGRDPHGSHLLNPERSWDPGTFYRRTFIPAARRAGQSNVRLYDLRSTFASLMASAGVDLFKVSRWLGHTSTVVTERYYARLFTTDPDRESAALARLLDAQRAAAAPAAVVVRTLRA